MQICFVSQEYPEETGWGGIGTYTFEMAHALARTGHKAIVVSRALSHPQHYFEDDGVEVYRILPSLDLASTPVLWRLNRWWEGYRLAVAIKLKQILRERKIDLIESPELHAEPLLHSLSHSKPPLVVRLHSGSSVVMNFEPGHKDNARLKRGAESWLVSKAAHITSPSEALRHSVNGRGAGRFTVIPNPVDVDHFKPNTDSGLRDSSANVLCVGRPRFLKGIHVLARAMPGVWENCPDTTFTFAPAPLGKGGGSARDAYREILGDLIQDSRVRVLDPVSRTELPDVYGNAAVCVVPSLWEGFGYVAAEAMACGAAVVASRVGGLMEIIEDRQSGLLFEPGNAEDLGQAVIGLLRDPERGLRIGQAARKRIVDEFSSPMIASQTADVYRTVVKESVQRN